MTEHPRNREEVAALYPEAADEIATTPVRTPEELANLERFAAAWEIRHEREREANRDGGSRYREREANRARYEYGLYYDRNAYTPPHEREG